MSQKSNKGSGGSPYFNKNVQEAQQEYIDALKSPQQNDTNVLDVQINSAKGSTAQLDTSQIMNPSG